MLKSSADFGRGQPARPDVLTVDATRRHLPIVHVVQHLAQPGLFLSGAGYLLDHQPGAPTPASPGHHTQSSWGANRTFTNTVIATDTSDTSGPRPSGVGGTLQRLSPPAADDVVSQAPDREEGHRKDGGHDEENRVGGVDIEDEVLIAETTATTIDQARQRRQREVRTEARLLSPAINQHSGIRFGRFRCRCRFRCCHLCCSLRLTLAP